MNKIIVRAVHLPTDADLGLMTGAAKMTQVRGLMPDGVELNVGLLGRLLKMGHTSVLEHADFAVVVENATRVFLAQITRHRLASFTSASQQYQVHDGFDYLVPPFSPNDPEEDELHRRYVAMMIQIDSLYQDIERLLGRDWARYILPGACRNTLLMKGNLREWFTVVFPQRLCKRNTPETLLVMSKALHIAANGGMVELCKHTGPACLTIGVCDQGSMCCGKPYRDWTAMLPGASI